MTVVGHMQCYGWKLILPSSVLYMACMQKKQTPKDTLGTSARTGSFRFPRAFYFRVRYSRKELKKEGIFGAPKCR